MTTEQLTEEVEVQRLSFWTEGEGFTNLMRDLYQSGEFSKVIDILRDGGCQPEQIKEFFQLKLKFMGDTRTEEGMSLVEETEDLDWTETFKTAFRTYFNSKEQADSYYGYELKDMLGLRNHSRKNDFQLLLEFFTFEEIRDVLYVELLSREGFRLATSPEAEDKISNGVILKNGDFVICSYQEHDFLYRILYQLGLASDGSWTDDNETIHVSSSSVSGTVSSAIEHYGLYKDVNPSEAQLKTLFDYRYHITEGFYGGSSTNHISKVLREYVNDKYDKGGKFGNLMFLREFYPEINLPRFSLNVKEIPKDSKVFIRTSPKKSMPGLLESSLVNDRNEAYEIHQRIENIKHDFKKNTERLNDKYNEIYWFFQEFLDGPNGVAHFFKDEFKYQLSSNQGDVVKGIVGEETLSQEHHNELHKICKLLSDDMNLPIQVEFVIHEGEVFIVQLRVLKNHYERAVRIKKPEDAIINGETFSRGNIEVDTADILVVESDGESELLIGKKALIVESNAEFSHLLALSKELKIPSMFNTGRVDLSDHKSVRFTAYNKEAWITKI